MQFSHIYRSLIYITNNNNNKYLIHLFQLDISCCIYLC